MLVKNNFYLVKELKDKTGYGGFRDGSTVTLIGLPVFYFCCWWRLFRVKTTCGDLLHFTDSHLTTVLTLNTVPLCGAVNAEL